MCKNVKNVELSGTFDGLSDHPTMKTKSMIISDIRDECGNLIQSNLVIAQYNVNEMTQFRVGERIHFNAMLMGKIFNPQNFHKEIQKQKQNKKVSKMNKCEAEFAEYKNGKLYLTNVKKVKNNECLKDLVVKWENKRGFELEKGDVIEFTMSKKEDKIDNVKPRLKKYTDGTQIRVRGTFKGFCSAGRKVDLTNVREAHTGRLISHIMTSSRANYFEDYKKGDIIELDARYQSYGKISYPRNLIKVK